ncbi:MAG TPA: ADP-ribosylglycohydrolase family protein, partial [Ktedonobacteraceae bacterium]
MPQQCLHDEPLRRATRSLEGLSVGDALGDHYFIDSLSATIAPDLIATRTLPPSPWYYTDDTEMALSLFATLRHHQTINQEYLAESFARHYDAARGYGEAMHGLLRRIRTGHPWQP